MRELFGGHVVRVPAERGDSQRAVQRIRPRLAASAELRQVDVGDAHLPERRPERLGAEVRMPPGSGNEPDVRERSDIGRPQRRDELLERPRAMTDGPDVHPDQCGRLGR